MTVGLMTAPTEQAVGYVRNATLNEDLEGRVRRNFHDPTIIKDSKSCYTNSLNRICSVYSLCSACLNTDRSGSALIEFDKMQRYHQTMQLPVGASLTLVATEHRDYTVLVLLVATWQC
jgi:hypothetical protein